MPASSHWCIFTAAAMWLLLLRLQAREERVSEPASPLASYGPQEPPQPRLQTHPHERHRAAAGTRAGAARRLRLGRSRRGHGPHPDRARHELLAQRSGEGKRDEDPARHARAPRRDAVRAAPPRRADPERPADPARRRIRPASRRAGAARPSLPGRDRPPRDAARLPRRQARPAGAGVLRVSRCSARWC